MGRPRRSSTCLVALTALACATADAPPGTTVLMSSASGAMVVLPMNVVRPLPESLEEAAPGAWQELRAYLQAHEIALKTLAPDVARRLWLESAREARAANPRAGFYDAARILAAKIAAHSEFEALLIPSLFVQGALVSGRIATWDGAEREVRIDAGAWAEDFEEEAPFGGAIPAASLQVLVLDADGELVHERQSGLALLASVRFTGRREIGAPGFAIEPLDDPFAERAPVLDGIARALDPYLTPLASEVILQRISEAPAVRLR